MTRVEDHLGGDILRRPAQCVRTIPGLQSLDKAKICQLHVAIILNQDVLWLQVAVDQVLAMHELKDEDNLSRVESCEGASHGPNPLQNIQKLTLLHVLHEDVEVAAVLGYSSHLRH